MRRCCKCSRNHAGSSDATPSSSATPRSSRPTARGRRIPPRSIRSSSSWPAAPTRTSSISAAAPASWRAGWRPQRRGHHRGRSVGEHDRAGARAARRRRAEPDLGRRTCRGRSADRAVLVRARRPELPLVRLAGARAATGGVAADAAADPRRAPRRRRRRGPRRSPGSSAASRPTGLRAVRPRRRADRAPLPDRRRPDVAAPGAVHAVDRRLRHVAPLAERLLARSHAGGGRAARSTRRCAPR